MKFIKHFFVCSLPLITTTLTYAQESSKQVFESPKLKDAVAMHKTVAILPIKNSISYKGTPPKNFSAEENAKEEKANAENMQHGMYTYLLRKADKYSVSFQDVDRTNALLKKNNMYDKLDEALPDELAKILGVDAVIKSTYTYQKTASEAGAIVGAVLFGSLGSKTASGTLTMQIYNGKDGELLWRFVKSMNESLMSNANEVMERMMKKVARNFPYEK